MTRDEILAMPAGRDMDALVGEYVFGWEKGTFPVYEPMKSKHGDYMVRPISNYSTDISAAWDVVEKLKESSLWLDLNTSPDGCQVGFADYFVFADTAPLAICRAALLAVADIDSGDDPHYLEPKE